MDAIGWYILVGLGVITVIAMIVLFPRDDDG